MCRVCFIGYITPGKNPAMACASGAHTNFFAAFSTEHDCVVEDKTRHYESHGSRRAALTSDVVVSSGTGTADGANISKENVGCIFQNDIRRQ